MVGQLLSDPAAQDAAKAAAGAVKEVAEAKWKAEVSARLGATEEQLEQAAVLLEVLQRDMLGLLAEVRDRQHRPEDVRRLIEDEIARHPEWQKGRRRLEEVEGQIHRWRGAGLNTNVIRDLIRGLTARSDRQPQVGDTLDGWRLEALAGRGGMGRVFRATKAGETKAVKVMQPELSGNPAAEDRFKKEMMALMQLGHHDGLVTLSGFGFCQTFGCWYLVMPFVEGETLQARLERSGALGADAAREVFAGLAGALASAHGRGVFHRDIKPANVILTADGRAVLVDFGVARVAGGSGGTGLSAYTALFAAPEQMRTGHADARSDVYSLAATLYYALRYDDPSARDPHLFEPGCVPKRFRDLLAQSMHNNPSRRPPDAKAFSEQLVRGETRSRSADSELAKTLSRRSGKLQITCPTCDIKLTVPWSLMGQKVRCAACRTIITVEAADRPPRKRVVASNNEPDEGDRPPRRRQEEMVDDLETADDRPRRRQPSDAVVWDADDRPKRFVEGVRDEDTEGWSYRTSWLRVVVLLLVLAAAMTAGCWLFGFTAINRGG